MIKFINIFNIMIFAIFTLFYSYQIYFTVISLFCKNKYDKIKAKKLHKYAVVIAARNESVVIGGLIDSIKKLKYPKELLDIFVVADNCTDNTAEVARNAGAYVYERFDTTQIGKGYALNFVFNNIEVDFPDNDIEAYIVFDADNLIDENYVLEMNKLFDEGYRVITSYRNSKNYDSNWISAGYSLWFLREAKYLNNARMLIDTNCAISGTGFMVSREIIKKNHGWKHFLLTEDIEFSIDCALQGEKIGYCANAIVYDEQPCTWKQSWVQRLRWSKGFYQVFGKYGKRLVKNIFKKHSFSCYDMLMTITPALFVSLASVLVNSALLVYGLYTVTVDSEIISITLTAIMLSLLNFYVVFYFFGLLTTITEWKSINCSTASKLKFTFTFPFFIFTYIPISLVALFKKIEWQPVTHTITTSIEDYTNTIAK